jgi:hypothetical protein
MTEAEVIQVREALALIKQGLEKFPENMDTRELSELCYAYAKLEEEFADPEEDKDT